MTRSLLASGSIGAALLASAYACTGFEEGASGAEPDAGPDASPAPDAPVTVVDSGDAGTSAKRCAHEDPFTSFRQVDGVNSPGREGSPRLTPDELAIYFDRQPGSGADWAPHRAQRAKRTDAFDPSVPVVGLPANSFRVEPRADELEVSFTQFTPAPVISRAFRNAKTDMLGAIEPHPLALAGDERDFVSFSKDRREALFATFDDSSSANIAHAILDADGGVVDAAVVDSLNTLANETDVVLSLDGLAVYFYSDRIGGAGFGSIFVAQRDTPTSVFRTPRRIEELVPPQGKFTAPGFVSEDACRLYYYADETAGAEWDLFIAERTPK